MSGYPRLVTGVRVCTVSLRDAEGVVHTVQVHAASLYEAAARGVAAFREQGWAAEALTHAAVLRVQVHLSPVIHDVPLKAVEQWLRSPSGSPKEHAVKSAAAGSRPHR